MLIITRKLIFATLCLLLAFANGNAFEYFVYDSNDTVPTMSAAPTSTNITSEPPTISEPPTLTPTSNTTESFPPSPSPSGPSTASPAPSNIPTQAPTSSHHHHHHFSLWKIIGKTIAWLIICGLSVLAFGAIFSNRYRIYYYLKASWNSFLRLQGTQKVLRFLRLEGFVYGGGQEISLNEIIFDSDLRQGLMD